MRIPRSVRASRLERRRPPPGDDLILDAIVSLTHAITIRRPRHEVWPWLGSLFPALPGATRGFHVLTLQRDMYLVIGRKPQGAAPLMTWVFVLEERPGWTTRLIVRARGGRAYTFHGLPAWLATPIIRIGYFFTQRQQLRTIAERVESQPRS